MLVGNEILTLGIWHYRASALIVGGDEDDEISLMAWQLTMTLRVPPSSWVLEPHGLVPGY